MNGVNIEHVNSISADDQDSQPTTSVTVSGRYIYCMFSEKHNVPGFRVRGPMMIYL